jgi:hypothetical protein
MKKPSYLLLATVIFAGCTNKEAAIKTAVNWTQDNILRFYENPRIEESEYEYCKYDETKLYGKIVDITATRANRSKREYEYSHKYGINSRSDEERNITSLRNTLLTCKESAYKTVMATDINYIEVLIRFTYNKENVGRGQEYLTVVMTANTLQVLNPLITREKCEKCKEWGWENVYEYDILKN